MAELIALYLAGLSFFFTGMAGISDNLRQMAGQRFRLLLSRATHHPARAGLLGVLAGAVTQNTSVVAFILSGMIATGLLPLRRALVVLAWANVGTAALVFMATVDLRLPILYLIGFSGLLLAFRLLARWKPAIACLLSLGLLFFGLEMMKQAFQPLTGTHGLETVSRFFEYWPDAAFFLGTLMRSVIHSSSATAAIAITINKSSMLGEFPAMMAMSGLGLGTALGTFFLSGNQRGISRQIAIYQMVTNVAAAIITALLLFVEHASGAPMLMALLQHLSSSLSGRMAFMYLFFNLAITGFSLAGLRWAPAWLHKVSPPTPEEDLSRPMYLDAEALLSPETAPDMAALEQQRLMHALVSYLDAARAGDAVRLRLLHPAAIALGGEISRFLDALVRQPIASGLAARIIAGQRRQETLRALEENVFLFAETLGQRGRGELQGRLVEALDTLLLTAMDALESKQPADIELLVTLTEDRGGMMERLRSRHSVGRAGEASHIAALHYATTLFERNVWLLRQLALSLREELARGNV
jgi:phosphate:Na+ symporter